MSHPTSKSNGVAASDAQADSPAFNLKMLLEHSDPTRGVPLETHRAGVGGRVLLMSKWLFRTTCKPLINELFSRQRLFNRYVTDSYAQMSAELQRLRQQVDALSESQKAKSLSTRATGSTRKSKPT